MPESGLPALSPFSLSLILDCLHRVVLALRAYSCLKEKCSLTQLTFILGQPKPVESRLFDNLSPIHSSWVSNTSLNRSLDETCANLA